MDFDHVRGVKLFNIAAEFHRRPWSIVLAEIAKCEVVCANCHRIRTHSGDRRGRLFAEMLAGNFD